MDYQLNMTILNYYVQKGQWQHIGAHCDNLLRERGEDPVWRFWKAFSVDQCGDSSKAVNEYRLTEGRREVHLPRLVATIRAHKRCRLQDNEAIEELEAKVNADAAAATVPALLLLTNFYIAIGDSSNAKKTAGRLQDTDFDEYLHANVLKGYIDLHSDRETHRKNAVARFDAVLERTGENVASGDSCRRNTYAALGRITWLYDSKQYQEALDLANIVAIQQPTFWPVLAVKANLYMAMNDWEQAGEMGQQLLAYDATNIDGYCIAMLHTLVRRCNLQSVASMLAELDEILEQSESQNVDLMVSVVQPLQRLAGSNPVVSAALLKYLERAKELDENHSNLLVELGLRAMVDGDVSLAMKYYTAASEADASNVAAVHGIIRTNVILDNLEDAQRSLDFLKELQTATGTTSEAVFIEALIRWRTYANDPAARVGGLKGTNPAALAQKESVAKLVDAFKLYSKELDKALPQSYAFFHTISAELLMAIIREFLQHCPIEPLSATDPPNAVVEKVSPPLELLTRYVPGLIEGQFLLARHKFILGRQDLAQHIIAKCISLDETYADAHLLSAQISFAAENYPSAMSALDQAVAHDFTCRDWLSFCITKGRVHTASGETEEAVTILTHALSLVKNKTAKKAYTLQEEATVYSELAVNMSRAIPPNFEGAIKVLAAGREVFKGTREEGRIMLAHASVVARKDVDQALNLLRSIDTDSPYYLKGKAQMAHIYLVQKNNKRLFAKCFEELAQTAPSAASFGALGDAYLSIQEPDKALEALRKAKDLAPNDWQIAQKLGAALVTTHQFEEAIRYYNDAVEKDPERNFLRLDLGRLLIRLGRFEHARDVLEKAQSVEIVEGAELTALREKVRALVLLCGVYQKLMDPAKSNDALTQARVLQSGQVLQLCRDETAETIFKEKTILADICAELGEMTVASGKPERAITFFTEALKADETHEKSMFALAEIHLKKEELDDCEHELNAVLKIDPHNERAIMMLADLAFRRNQLDEAILQFQGLLEKKPNNYVALHELVLLLRRAERLHLAPKYLQAAENASARARLDPGLRYCQGFYYNHSGEIQKALHEYNGGRRPRDALWSERCVVAMLECYIYPEGANLWEPDVPPMTPQQLQQCEELLQEITDNRTKQMVEAYIQVALRTKDSLEKALSSFFNIMNNTTVELAVVGTEKIDVPCLVGMSIALQLLKQSPKARNYLKKVAKAVKIPSQVAEFEKGWLLLADIYIANGKHDNATELLKMTLNSNKSCARAWEFLGLIYEKETSYRDAAECYEHAWELSRGSDPVSGYRLAFNYLKAKKFVPAIDICHQCSSVLVCLVFSASTYQVLKKNRDYPKIRKDVLDKARASLRP